MPEDIFHIEPTIVPKNGTPVAKHSETNRRELRSERAMEIISNRPGFLVRWGNFFFLAVLSLMIIACWFIWYPDIIQSTAKLTSINAPKPVISYTNRKLIKLLTSEKQFVKQGDIIGFIESIADHREILKASAYADSMEKIISKVRLRKYKIYQL